MRREIHNQVTNAKVGDAFLSWPSPLEHFQSRDEFGDRERLGHIIVAARSQTGDLVLDRTERAEHQNGSLVSSGAKRLQYLHTIDVRQHTIENDRVIKFGGGLDRKSTRLNSSH